MTTPPLPPPDAARTGGLVCGWIALIPVALLWLALALMPGMGGLLPLIGFGFTGWIWFILAVVGLALSARSRRPLAGVIVSSVALIGAAAGSLMFLAAAV